MDITVGSKGLILLVSVLIFRIMTYYDIIPDFFYAKKKNQFPLILKFE